MGYYEFEIRLDGKSYKSLDNIGHIFDELCVIGYDTDVQVEYTLKNGNKGKNDFLDKSGNFDRERWERWLDRNPKYEMTDEQYIDAIKNIHKNSNIEFYVNNKSVSEKTFIKYCNGEEIEDIEDEKCTYQSVEPIDEEIQDLNNKWSRINSNDHNDLYNYDNDLEL